MNFVADAASKHALQSFFDSLRAEVADHGIHVSVISPSYMRTNLSLNALTADGTAYGSKCDTHCCNKLAVSVSLIVSVRQTHMLTF